MKLDGSSKISDDKVAFALHSYLWGKAENRLGVINPVTERIPHLGLSPATSGVNLRVGSKVKFQFMDLANVPGWPNGERVAVATYFLIRGEYEQLDQFLHDDKHAGRDILLLGHPGIGLWMFQVFEAITNYTASGKTVYLTYSLVKRLAEGRPTFFCAQETRRYLFQASGVYKVSGEAFGVSRASFIEDQSDNTLCLYDLNANQKEFINTRGWRVVVASSPKEERYKEWAKQANAVKFVMRTWPWREIYASR